MFPFLLKPVYRLEKSGLALELWVSRRRFPTGADAIVVPVAPDLKMVFGVAKIARDYGANTVQYEANKVAPLAPGKAFLGAGARYRYKYTTLAVIFDEVKRTSPELIAKALKNALRLAESKGARSVLIPDMTENLLQQPNWITDEQRQSTAQNAARILVDAIVASRGIVPRVKIWVWDPQNADLYVKELKRVGSTDWAALSASNGADEDGTNGMTNSDGVATEAGRSTVLKRTAMVSLSADAWNLEADALVISTASGSEEAATPVAAQPAAGGIAVAETDGRHDLLPSEVVRHLGPKAREEWKALPPLALGDAAVIEAAGHTRLKYVLPAATRPSGSPAISDAIGAAVRNALDKVEAMGLKSVVIPNLGGGENDYPTRLAARLIVETAANYLLQPNFVSRIEKVIFAAADPEEAEAFADAVTSYVPDPVVEMISHIH